MVDYLVRCKGLGEWRVVRVGVSTLVGEVVEELAYEFSKDPILEQCHLYYELQSLPFDLRVCGVPAQAQFKPGFKPQSASQCLQFEMAFSRPPPLTPSLLRTLSKTGTSGLSVDFSSGVDLDGSQSGWPDSTRSSIGTRAAHNNLLLTIKFLGTGDEPRRIYVCGEDPVGTIRDALGVPAEDFTLCCDGRPILNETSTFEQLRITRKNVLGFKPGPARSQAMRTISAASSSRAASARRIHLHPSGAGPTQQAMSPTRARATALGELAAATSPTSPVSSSLSGQEYRQRPHPLATPLSPSALQRTSSGLLPYSSLNASVSDTRNDGLYQTTNSANLSVSPRSPLRDNSPQREGTLSVLFIDPEDLDFVHSLDVNPSRAVFGLFSFVNGGSEMFSMFCDGVLVRDPTHTFGQVTRGHDGCVFSFRQRRDL